METEDKRQKQDPMDESDQSPALVAPVAGQSKQHTCAQCQWRGRSVRLCPVSNLWFCNESCRQAYRRATQTQPITVSSDSEEEAEPDATARRRSHRAPKPMEGAYTPEKPARRAVPMERNAKRVRYSQPVQQEQPQPPPRSSQQQQQQQQQKRPQQQAKPLTSNVTTVSKRPVLRLEDTMSPWKYDHTERLKRAMGDERRVYARKAAERSEEDNAQALQKIQRYRDSLVQHYQSQIETLEAGIDHIGLALRQWESLHMFGDERYNAVQAWLQDDRLRVKKLCDARDAVTETHPDAAFSALSASQQPQADASPIPVAEEADEALDEQPLMAVEFSPPPIVPLTADQADSDAALDFTRKSPSPPPVDAAPVVTHKSPEPRTEEKQRKKKKSLVSPTGKSPKRASPAPRSSGKERAKRAAALVAKRLELALERASAQADDNESEEAEEEEQAQRAVAVQLEADGGCQTWYERQPLTETRLRASGYRMAGRSDDGALLFYVQRTEPISNGPQNRWVATVAETWGLTGLKTRGDMMMTTADDQPLDEECVQRAQALGRQHTATAATPANGQRKRRNTQK